MFKHILVTAANKDNTETIAESYFQVNLFGKQLKLFKRRTKLTVKQKEHKPTDDYINIRIPNLGDVPIVTLDGGIPYGADDWIESIKFIWVTKTFETVDFNIPYVEVRMLSDKNRPSKIVRGFGDELEAEYRRNKVSLSSDAFEDLMVAVTSNSNDDTAKGYRIVDRMEADLLVTFHCVDIYTRMADGSMKCITNRFNSLDGVTLYIKEEDYSYCNDLPIRPEVSE
ncbi:hypothetical protein [Brochothrix thermosphacta]|uniref:hypothetical protein n=1 Tax=Brochothrix thermosphacta TaxID=2756 RepID=UPI00083FCCF4|nr:hypothetical protein [Brochothrix thermosphacta]ODJ73352.1 hypothetical protein BFR39_03250 [Brochothrix thermosphacta]